MMITTSCNCFFFLQIVLYLVNVFEMASVCIKWYIARSSSVNIISGHLSVGEHSVHLSYGQVRRQPQCGYHTS